MRNINLFFSLFWLTLLLPASVSAQCQFTIDAGEDITLCEPPETINLNAYVDGSVVEYNWTPSPYLDDPYDLQSPVHVTQTTSFILNARSDELEENLVFNPDFEQGNIGFWSDLVYSPGSLIHPGSYDVLADPQSANDSLYACGDHTSGSGNMLAASLKYNFSYYPNIWCQTVPVTPNTDYYFSYWATKLSPANGFILFLINGVSVSSMNLNASVPKCEWVNKNGIWNSGNNTSATLCIRNLKYAHISAIDDIFFAPFCTKRDTVTVFVKNVKAVAAPSGYPIPCDGTETTLSGAGSSTGPGITYQWSTPDGNIVSGENTLNPVVNAPGTYTLTVTLLDAIGNCTKTATAEVFLNNVLEIGIDAPPTLNCYLPYVILKGLSNQTTSTYQWTAGPGGNIVSGANTATARVDQPGEYTLLVTNTATGCTAETSVVIDPPTLPAAVATSTPITCASQQSTLSGAGSSNGPNFSYAWSTPNGNIVSGQNSLNASADAPGNYILAVTNNLNNCSATDTVTVTAINTLPQVNVLPADNITCLQNNITLETDSATAGAHFIYAWTASAGGNIVSGANSLAPVVNAPGLYILAVTDTLSACTGTDSVWVAADTDAVIAIAGANGPLTCVNNSVTLNADGSSMDPSLVYQWITSNGNIVSGANSPNPTVNAPGDYQLTLTNPLNGCSASDMVEVTQNTAPPQVALLPHPSLSCALPLLVLQGQNAAPQGNFSYTWTAENGGHIVAGDSTLTLCVDAAGTYSLLATNLGNGCTAVVSTSVTADFAAPDLALAVSGVLNCHNPSVNLLNSGLTDPALLNHEWTTPDGSVVNTGANPSLDAQLPGNYTLLVSNTQNGCTATAAATVTQHQPVTATPTAQADASCFGAADGAAAVVASGGDGSYSFLWSNGETTASVSNLEAGAYTVIVTDGENCTASTSFVIAQPDALLANASATPISIIGAADGTAQANPQGGTAPYTYLWNNGATTPLITGLPEGSYTVTVTDANSCTAVQTVEVWGGDCFILADFQTVDPLCSGLANGQATVLPNGGSAPYSYLWSSGSTEQTATDLAAGTYGVTVTDANGCPFFGIVSLEEPPVLTLAVGNVVHNVCAGASEGSATVIAAGGTGAIGIGWSNGQTGPTASSLAAGTYTSTATDANGCTSTATATIQAIDPEPPMIQAGNVTVPLGPSGEVELSLQNLGASVSDNCALAGVQLVPDVFDCFDLGEQQVTISAQDVSGNNSTQTIVVTFVDIQAPVLECPANINRCYGNNIVEYPAPVALDNCLILGGTFELVNGLPSGSHFPQGVTTNIYTYADVSGNMGSCSFQVTVLSPLDIQLDALVHDVNNQNIGSIQVTVGGSMPDYTYEWTLDGAVVATTEDLNGIGMGLYTLWVTDAAGCKKEAGPFEVTSLVGTDDPGRLDFIAVYPNPSSGRVFAVLPDDLAGLEADFVVFDGTGRRVLEHRSIREKRVELDLSHLVDGLYSILIRVGQGLTLRKIVINR